MKNRSWNSPRPSVTVVSGNVRKAMKSQEKQLLTLSQERIMAKLDMKKDILYNQRVA